MTETLLCPARVWDLAGIDGLQIVQQCFGPAVAQLAPFQSLETTLEGQDCSILRLCDRNFRLTYDGDLTEHLKTLGARTWLKPLDWMGAIALPNDYFPQLLAHASVRLPHRLQGLPLHCAVPAQVGESACGMAPLTAVLIWRHPIAGQPAIEIHTAVADLAKLQETISAWVS